jgi:deoxyhypusine synthase
MLQTEPHIHEVLGLPEQGHDYFIQFTDARIDTGGLSGATPSEAVTWGKIEPDQLRDAIVCYGDSTIYLPLLIAYTMNRAESREPARLATRLDDFVSRMRAAAPRGTQ